MYIQYIHYYQNESYFQIYNFLTLIYILIYIYVLLFSLNPRVSIMYIIPHGLSSSFRMRLH